MASRIDGGHPPSDRFGIGRLTTKLTGPRRLALNAKHAGFAAPVERFVMQFTPDDVKPFYTDGKRYIFHGDCRDLLPKMRQVGAVVTDPPYGINTKSDGSGKLNPWADYCNAAMFYQWWIGECRRAIVANGCLWTCLNWRSIVTFQKAACDVAWPIESMLVWDKCWIGPGGPKGLRPSYELVALFPGIEFSIADRGLPDVQRFKWSSKKPHHPAEKPVQLMKWLIETVPNDGAILDPFMGSGTTLRAAKDLDRAAIGIEVDERHCETAAERLRQGSLFAA